MAAHQDVGAAGMSRELSGTSPQAPGPPSALGAGKLLRGLSSHGPGDVSALTPALAGEAGQLSSTKGYEDIQHLWTCRGLGVNVRCPTICNGFAASTHGFSDVLLLLLWLLQTTRRNHPPRPLLCPFYLVWSCSQKPSLMLTKAGSLASLLLPGAFSPSSESLTTKAWFLFPVPGERGFLP